MKQTLCQKVELQIDIAQSAKYLKVIAETNRLKILCLLRDGEKCVCDIWQELKMPQNLASHHLKQLKKAGLLNDRRAGLKIFYYLDQEKITSLHNLINQIFASYEPRP